MKARTLTPTRALHDDDARESGRLSAISKRRTRRWTFPILIALCVFSYFFLAARVRIVHLDKLVQATPDRGLALWSDQDKEAFFQQKFASSTDINSFLSDKSFLVTKRTSRLDAKPLYENDVYYFDSHQNFVRWRDYSSVRTTPIDLERGHWSIELNFQIMKYNNARRYDLVNRYCWWFDDGRPEIDNCFVVSDLKRSIFRFGTSVEQRQGDLFDLAHAVIAPFHIPMDEPVTFEGLLARKN